MIFMKRLKKQKPLTVVASGLSDWEEGSGEESFTPPLY
jgi:hypothetical protein